MRIIPIIVLSLLLAFHASAQNLKSAISAIGCKKIVASELKPNVQNKTEYSDWLKNEFGVIKKSGFVARCPAAGSYHRFLFEEEVFENEQKANERLKNLRRLPPGEHDKSDYAVTKILGTGFVRGKRLYTVGAFAVFIHDQGYVTKLNAKLKRKMN